MFSRNGAKAPAGTNHWIKQSAGSGAVAKFQAVGDDALDSEVLGQRAHHVLERLADQNHVGAGFHKLLHCPNTFWLQARLELVLEIFFSQQVQTIPGYAAQDCVHDAGGKLAVGGIKNGRSTAIRKMRPRRRKRSAKVCAFQVKNATGLTTVRSSKLPSTRQ